ncbi:MAG TPA: phospho-N-acetylmuramoyl-pentapeptide-transferase [Crocinitomix sp.]|nr:phospho-N-acetylmuramoyl-pentapeptide-transferase [Crocinitomix sp.]
MLYYLFTYLDELGMPGAGVFHYVSFRTAMAIITSLLISLVFGKRIINVLRKAQMGETIRDLGLEGQMEKQGTPTMGGLIIIASIVIPTLLFAKLNNIYVVIMLVSTVMLGTIGFIDDYIKVFKKNKEGLAGRFKIVGQIAVGVFVGSVLYFHPDVQVHKSVSKNITVENSIDVSNKHKQEKGEKWVELRDMTTTIPFVKDNEFNYTWVAGEKWGWLIFIPVVIFIVVAISNGANMTDGLDGLAAGSSAIIGLALAIFAYISGHVLFADYLNIMYIPNSSELVIFIGAFVGATVGFLWHNSYPASVFMGDTGSLAIGGIIAVFAIVIRKELLLPVLCGIFLAENLSVIMQVGYFKYTKKKYGEGKRIFKMAPLHHHYQKLGMHESKIVARFWIVGILLAVITIVTLKLR